MLHNVFLVSHTVELVPQASLTKRCANFSADLKFCLKKNWHGRVGKDRAVICEIKAVIYTMTSKLTKGISLPNKIAFPVPTMCCASPEPLTHLEGPVKLSAGLRAVVVYVLSWDKWHQKKYSETNTNICIEDWTWMEQA